MPDLTTLDAVKLWAAIPSVQTGSDALLDSLITATSADFLREIDRTDLLQATYTAEPYEGDGGSRLTLRHWPITAVSALTIAGAVVPPVSPGVFGWYIDTQLDPERINQLYLLGTTYTDAAVVAVTYTAGYATVPADIAQAVVEWVVARYKGRDGVGVASQRDAGGEHVTYDRSAAMPPNTARVVDRYRRKWPTLDRRNEERNYRVTRINRTYTQTMQTTDSGSAE